MSDEPSKCTNYLKIVKLLVDVGTETARGLFYHFKPKDRVELFFQSQTICDELSVLKRQNRLSREQYHRLIFDPSPDPDEFDLSLLLTLITNLFKHTIDGPTHGWEKQVAQDDISLGADLLRLKDIRNKVVGHRPNTELSSDEFEELWKQSECVLIRITEFLDSTKKEEITSKINECKESALDETSERRYMSLLHTWHDEAIKLLSHLQNEIDMLCKKAEGFDIFFASEIPDRFLRYILLLCEGGLLVLAGIMKRELDKHQKSLLDILLQNKDTLIVCHRSAASVIFSDDSLPVTDITLWGTNLLSYVIVTLFHTSLTSMEQTAVAGIGSASKDYGKVAMESLDSDTFRSYWTDIVLNINILANGLDSETRLESLMLIKKHDTEQVDETTAKRYLMQLRKNCEPLRSLVEQYIDLREKLRDAVKQMQREGACFRKDQVIELKMMTFGKIEEKKEIAENILYTIWKAAVHNTGGSTDFPTVKAEIDNILQGVNGIHGIKKVDVEKRCIVLTIICASCESILNLLDLFATPLLLRFMVEASHVLSSYCKEKVVVTAFITADSMQTTLQSLGNGDDCGTTSNIRLTFGCSSADDIENVRDLLQRNEISNSINQMAHPLSNQLSEKITIRTSLVAEGVSDIYSNTLIPIMQSPWIPFVLPADIGVPEQVPEFSHSHHLQSILDELEYSKSEASNLTSKVRKRISKSLDTLDSIRPLTSEVRARISKPLNTLDSIGPIISEVPDCISKKLDQLDGIEPLTCKICESYPDSSDTPDFIGCGSYSDSSDSLDFIRPGKSEFRVPYFHSFDTLASIGHGASKFRRRCSLSLDTLDYNIPITSEVRERISKSLDTLDSIGPITSVVLERISKSFYTPDSIGPLTSETDKGYSDSFDELNAFRSRSSGCRLIGSGRVDTLANETSKLLELLKNNDDFCDDIAHGSPAVNWDDYDIPKKQQRLSPCSSFGSFASIASNQSVSFDNSESRHTIG